MHMATPPRPRTTGCPSFRGKRLDLCQQRRSRGCCGSRADLDLVFPVIPSDIVDLKVTGNGRTDRWKEVAFAKLREQSKSLQFVFLRVFELGKAKFDPPLVQRFVQFGNGIASSDVDAGDRLGRADQPANGSWRCRHRVQNALPEELSVGEEQMSGPPEKDQP